MSGDTQVFRIDGPSAENLSGLEHDGFIAYPDVLTDEARHGLTDEILRCHAVADFLDTSQRNGEDSSELSFVEKPWNEKGRWAQGLFDAPLVSALLRASLGQRYHFCHSSIHIGLPGAGPVPFHQDNSPIDPRDRSKSYMQMLYYPNGFSRGDGSLWVIPGSHRIANFGEYAPYGPPHELVDAAFLNERYIDQTGRALHEEELELPPGSMVFLDARTYHAVSAKPDDSPQEIRLFSNYIFKAPGQQHRLTQEIPQGWLADADTERRQLFDRPAYSS
jgi:hypothetical protein